MKDVERKKEEEHRLFVSETKRIEKESLKFSRTIEEIQSYVTAGFLKVYYSRFEQNAYIKLSDIIAIVNRGYIDRQGEWERFKSFILTKGSYEFYHLSELNITELMYLMNRKKNVK